MWQLKRTEMTAWLSRQGRCLRTAWRAGVCNDVWDKTATASSVQQCHHLSTLCTTRLNLILKHGQQKQHEPSLCVTETLWNRRQRSCSSIGYNLDHFILTIFRRTIFSQYIIILLINYYQNKRQRAPSPTPTKTAPFPLFYNRFCFPSSCHNCLRRYGDWATRLS